MAMDADKQRTSATETKAREEGVWSAGVPPVPRGPHTRRSADAQEWIVRVRPWGRRSYWTAMVTVFDVAPPIISTTATLLPVATLAGTCTLTW